MSEDPGNDLGPVTASTVIRLPLAGPDDVDDGPTYIGPEHRRSIARSADAATRRRIAAARRSADADARAFERWREAGFRANRSGGRVTPRA